MVTAATTYETGACFVGHATSVTGMLNKFNILVTQSPAADPQSPIPISSKQPTLLWSLGVEDAHVGVGGAGGGAAAGCAVEEAQL